MSVQVWFDEDEVNVQPGESCSLSLAVENVGETTESYTIIPAGLTSAWTTVTRPNITLFGGSRDVVEVVVRPPAVYTTSAGPTTIAVRVTPRATTDDAVVAETIANIESYDDRRIIMLQPLHRGRRRATYEFMVENHGNGLASCRLHLVDASSRVDGAFDPPAVGVSPGSSGLVRLKLKANRSLFRRAERQLDFEVEATEPDHEAAVGRATLIQPPTIPGRVIRRTIALGIGIAALVFAWFSVVQPEIQDAADRAVDDRVGDLDDTSTTVAPTTTIADETDGVQAETEIGEPVSYRVSVDVGIAQERSEPLSIPPDSQLRLTDIVLQNPNGDLGKAQLLRNGDVLYEWDLGAMNSANEFQPRVSPLPFEPGDNLVLSVACDVAGETTGTGCEVSVLLGGILVPVND